MNKKALHLAYWLSLAMAVMCLAALAVIDESLKGPITPLGIVSLQLCAYTDNCAEMLQSWQGTASTMAAMSLGLDYLFMVVCPATICLGLLIHKTALPASLQRMATCLAVAVWLVTLFDAIENYHQFQMLLGQPIAEHAWLATLAATVKFALLAPALLMWLVSGIRHLFGKDTP